MKTLDTQLARPPRNRIARQPVILRFEAADGCDDDRRNPLDANAQEARLGFLRSRLLRMIIHNQRAGHELPIRPR